MNLLQKTNIPEQVCGPWRIERFTVTREQAAFHNLRCMIQGIGERAVPPGDYTRLMRGNDFSPIMSDTCAELNDHQEAVRRAHGSVLVAGLGLGIVIEATLRKPEVSHVTVIELSEHVIDMTGKYLTDKYGSDRLTIVMDDVYTWRPKRGTRYGMVWVDIWDDMCADNLPEMRRLTEKFRKRSDWVGCWARDVCIREARRDQTERYYE